MLFKDTYIKYQGYAIKAAARVLQRYCYQVPWLFFGFWRKRL